MSEEMNKEAEVQEEAVDIPVTDGSEEEAADTARQQKRRLPRNQHRQKKLSSQIRKPNLRRNRKPRQKLLSSARRKKRKINSNSRSRNLQTD